VSDEMNGGVMSQCGKCGEPITQGQIKRYYGAWVGHDSGVCIRILRSKNKALKERCELLYCAGAEECPMGPEIAALKALLESSDE